MRKKRKRPEGIKAVVSKVIERIEKQGPGKKEKILSAWQGAVGEKASRHSRPVSLRRRILTIEVDSSTWFYELSLKKASAIKAIKKELKEYRIEGIRFRMGDIT